MGTDVDVGSAHPRALPSSNEAMPYAALAPLSLLVVGAASGIVGGIAMAVPIVIWDWVHPTHRALELPMAATAWPFGLMHFSQDRNLWWPIVIGTALLAAYWALSGVAFGALADRFYRLPRPASVLAAGGAWSFVSFIFFWYMLLPIARDGAPFRGTAVTKLSTAPSWAWILGFTVFGLVIAGCYAGLRRPLALLHDEERKDAQDERWRRFRHAA